MALSTTILNWLNGSGQLATQKDLKQLKDKLMATQAELAADLRKVVEQQKKTEGEIRTLQTASDLLNEKITDLEKVIADGGATQELTDAVAAVKAQAQVVDDAIPDGPPEE